MPEYHPGTDVAIADNVPMSAFRNAIPNPQRYTRHNNVSVSDVCDAAYTGDYDLLEELLATGDEKMLYNGDVNAHVNNITALMMASMSGQTECVELLLQSKADPHVKERMKHGHDPEDGRTALEFAKGAGYDDIVELLEQAEKSHPYGWYVPSGKNNNAKIYNSWQWGKKPEKGFFSSRPGAAEYGGFDPMKYGTGPLPEAAEEDDFVEPGALAGNARPKPVASVLPAGPPPLPLGLLFPGQGSQYVKMMMALQDLPKVRDMCDKAKDILGYDLLHLCLNGPEEKLEQTRFCQPAMFLAGLAGLEKLRGDREEAASRFQVCAGLSLGEYTALCAAGVFTFEDGLRLVQLRGEAMQDAAQASKQLMLSVAGLDKDKLEKLCKEAARVEPNGVASIANELFPKGFSCAGTEKAINELRAKAEAGGALQAKILKTSGAFHTSLMAPARDRLSKALDETLPRMRPPQHIVYMNVTAEPLKVGTDPKDILPLLKQQLTSAVLWEQCCKNMISSGIKEFYEVGPMKQLKAMMKRVDNNVWKTTTNVEV